MNPKAAEKPAPRFFSGIGGKVAKAIGIETVATPPVTNSAANVAEVAAPIDSAAVNLGAQQAPLAAPETVQSQDSRIVSEVTAPTESLVKPAVDADPNGLAPKETAPDETKMVERLTNSPDSPPEEPSQDVKSPPEELVTQPFVAEPEPTIVPQAQSQPDEPGAKAPPVTEPEPTIVPEEPPQPVTTATPAEEAVVEPPSVEVNEQPSSMNVTKDTIFWANPKEYITSEGRLDAEKLNKAVERFQVLEENPNLTSDLEVAGISVPKAKAKAA